MEPANNLAELTADIVSAYVGKNHVQPNDLANLINAVHTALSNVGQPQEAAPEKFTAPMSWKKAIKPDGIISFEDGKSYRTLKRHLSSRGMTPAQYREKWGLPRDFPMVAPNYSNARSEMARRLGLGTKGPAARKAKKGSGKKRAAAAE
jgi:predicted transcriptional regulator